MHEASRRLLAVLLREIDGFDTSRRTVVIGATNRKQDLDAALLSRWEKRGAACARRQAAARWLGRRGRGWAGAWAFQVMKRRRIPELLLRWAG
jgi:hypothetical protein